MNQSVLITGASSGIGYEFAQVFARHGHDLILVARSGDKLMALQQDIEQRYGTQVAIFTEDLSDLSAPERLWEGIQQQGLAVDILVNNAGFGDYGPFAQADWPKQAQMLQLNIVALTHLTRLCLPAMVARGQGKVMTVASTAAFQPGPLMAVYYATKAYVRSFTQAIANELQGTGVTAMVLCPGPTRSQFQAASNLGSIPWFNTNRWPTAATVAEFGYEALKRNRVVAVHGFTNWFFTFLIRFLPDALVVELVRRIQSTH
jgi:uncharacterized protein